MLDCSIMELELKELTVMNSGATHVFRTEGFESFTYVYTYIYIYHMQIPACVFVKIGVYQIRYIHIERYILYTCIPVEEMILRCRLFWVLEELLDQQASEQVSKMEAKSL